MTLFSAILIAAHFYRSGSSLLAAIGLLFPALLLLRNRIALRIVQTLLLAAAIEWLRTLYTIALERQAAGVPWLRMVVILSVVAAFTAGTAFLLNRARTPVERGADD